jgi:hypothetical protein
MSPSRPPRRCMFPGCNELGDWVANGGRCDEHKNQIVRDRQHGRGAARTYSPAWKQLTAHAKACGNTICQSVDEFDVRCKNPVRAFHHIIPVEMRHDLELDWRNVVGVCQSCHNRVTFNPDAAPRERYVPLAWQVMGVVEQEWMELLPGSEATPEQLKQLWSLEERVAFFATQEIGFHA